MLSANARPQVGDTASGAELLSVGCELAGLSDSSEDFTSMGGEEGKGLRGAARGTKMRDKAGFR